ncbi:MAG: hypothetical protein C0618_01340 [Desulfuromonas sp.]|nr:MAG: hypothetical protein C0618_01340 [Desulfuromonas sp.]
MAWFWFFLFLIVVAGGLYFYQKLIALEQEIRREKGAPPPPPRDDSGNDVVKPEVAPPIFKEQVQLEPTETDDESSALQSDNLEDGLLKVVSDLPGLVQTEIYELFPEEERKRVQALLLKLDRDGKIRREKKKSSYRVFPS